MRREGKNREGRERSEGDPMYILKIFCIADDFNIARCAIY